MTHSLGWTIGALYLATVATFADLYVTQPLLPLLARDYGVDAATAGLTLSAVVLTTALCSSAYGPLSDVLGRRPLMVWGTVLLALATAACAAAPSLPILIALRALQGVLIPSVSALAVAFVFEELRGRDPSAIVGGYVAASVVGGLTGRIVSGLLTDATNWRVTFVFFGLLTLVGAVGLALALPAGASPVEPDARRELRSLSRDLARAYREMGAHLHDVRLVGGFVIGAALFFGFIGFFTYLPFLLTAPPFGLSTGAIAWVYTPYLAGVVVSPIAGRLAGRFSRRALIALGLAITIVALLASLAHSLVVVVVAAVVLCAGMFLAQPIVPTFVTLTATRARGSANALYQSFYYGGAVFGSTLPGLAWERWAWPGVVGVCVAGMVVALLADVLLCGRERPVVAGRFLSIAARTRG
ncbi:MAG TPA: MFS transporter [Candidatus Sulfotelmatobacter sp.]|nr:MFS transporter [Candidatus Sulfotelmatobacter sp.]